MRVFSESQKFDQWWTKLIYFAMIALFLYFIYSWYIAEEAVDKVGAEDTIGQLVVIASMLPVVIIFQLLKLKSEIDEIGIHYQFLPFHLSKKTIRWAEIEKCYVRTYSPIKEYGGWGYRVSIHKKGKAYNVKGNQGIQIEFKNGKKLLIGTQKASEARQVIDRHYKKQQ